MAIKTVVDKLEDIPEGLTVRELFAEKNGKFELTGIEGVKTQADFDRMKTAKDKEVTEHKATKERLGAWGDLKPEETIPLLDRLPDLEKAAKGKFDESAMAEAVTRQVEATKKTLIAPLERQIKTLHEQLKLTAEEATSLKGEKRQRLLHDEVHKARIAGKVLEEAEEDALLLADRVFEVTDDGKFVTKEGVGVTPGLSPKEWMAEIDEKGIRKHWWAPSVGGGAGGSRPGGGLNGGANPWSADGWNMTEQGKVVTARGMPHAEQLAKAAGTTVGGPRPQPAKR